MDCIVNSRKLSSIRESADQVIPVLN